MRIQHVKATEVVVPAKPGAINSPAMGRHLSGWDRSPICLIELETDDGITALGEVDRGHTLREIEPWLKQLPGLTFHGLSLAGLPDPWRAGNPWGLLERHPPALWQSSSPVLFALEMAVLDWAGKRLGCRAVELLGGAYREAVAVDAWCGRQAPRDLAAIVTRARELGFRGLKMKSAIGDPIIEQVRAVKDAAGHDFGITIDPMFQWLGPHEALATFKALEPFAEGLRIEDPFPQDRPELWQRVRQVSPIPLIWHARRLSDLRRALQERCADDFNCTGGLAEFRTMSHAVEVAGHSCWQGSSIEMGVAQVARLHAAAAARACVLPCDFVSGLVREHTLIAWNWPYKDGQLPLPAGPGLGIELDREAVRFYRQAEVEYAQS